MRKISLIGFVMLIVSIPTFAGGLLTNIWKTFYQNKQGQAKVFLALAEDDKGNIWAGTYSSGVYVIAANGRELMHIANGYGNTRFSSSFIFDLHKDIQGDIWMGGIQSDLACFNSKQNSFKLYASQPIKALTEFKPGKMLLGCSYGLLLLDKETANTEFLLQGYTVQDICAIGNDIWVATSGDGLLRYNYTTKSLEKINTSNGLISNHVNSVLYDNGFFWLGTEKRSPA
jgi:ligand-binding sensor domain-containing protein